MKRILVYFVAICLLAMFTIPAYAAPPKQHRFGVSFFDEGSAHSTPKSGRGDVYVVNDIIYFLDDNGVETSMIASAAATAWDDIGDPDGATAIDMTTFATTIDFGGTADMFILEFTGAFGDVSGMLLEQKTGNPTNGTILEIKLADTDPDFISLATSGVEVVNIDADAVVTLSPQSSPTNTIVLSPGAAATTAILITDTDYTNALSVGDNDILLTTGDINATNYDLTGATGDLALVGDVTAVDGTYSGNVSVTGTFLQDALSATTADATITLDGTGTGGVSIGTVAGSGAITLGGSATAVTLPATVDLTLSGGDLTITDTANADTVAVTNNTMTTADLFQLTTGGTRTSGNVIKIIDSATTAPSIGITADSMTTGNVVAIQADALEAGGALLYLDSDGIPDTSTFYIEAAGTGTDYTLAKDGVAVHSGVASTDVITITTGDVQIDDGLLEIDTDEDDTTKIERAQATVTGPVVSIVEQTDTAASAVALLLLDQDTDSVPSSALEIDTEGAYAIKIDALIAAGDGVLVDVADSYTGQWTIIDAGPWLGTTGEGVWQFTSDSGAVNEVGQVIQVNLQGTGTAGTATEGKAFHAESQAAVKAGESLVYLDTLTNTALHIDNEGAAADGIKFDVAASYTGQGILADLGTWLGTGGEGFIEINSDAVGTVPAGQYIRMRQLGTGQHAAAIGGSLLYMEDDAAAPGGGTSYVMHIDATNIEAFRAAAGDVVVEDDIIANGNLTGDGATIMSAILQDSEDVQAANNDLAAAECGKVMFLNAAGGFQTTLPAVSTVPAGCTFEFIVIATGANYTIITGNTLENVLHGGVVERETDTGDDGPFQAAGDTMTFVNGQMVIGDYIKLISNGALYFVHGQVNADGAFTIIQAG